MSHGAALSPPITLIGVGRTGTSAIQALVASHEEIKVVGETAPLIFDFFELMVKLSENSAFREDDGNTDWEFIFRQIRKTYYDIYGSLEGKWFQKPIGLPRVYEEVLSIGVSIDAISERYWQVFRGVFPASKVALVLRDPCDNIVSIIKFAGETPEKAVLNYFNMLTILKNCRNEAFVFDFRSLVARDVSKIRELFDFWDVKMNSTCVDTLSVGHAKAFLHGNSSVSVVDRHDEEYSILNNPAFIPYLRRSYQICADMGISFEQPRFIGGGTEKLETLPPLEIEPLKEANRHLYFRCAAIQKQNSSLLSQVGELKQWIDDLERGKAWLEQKYFEHVSLLEKLRSLIG